MLDTDPTSFATGSWGETGAIPDDFLYAPAALPHRRRRTPRFLGTPETVAADIDTYISSGVRHFTLRFANGGPEVGVAELMAQMERFVTEVIPRLRSPAPRASGHRAVGLFAQIHGHLVPVDRPVEAHPHPSPPAHVRGRKKRAGVAPTRRFLGTGRRRATDGGRRRRDGRRATR